MEAIKQGKKMLGLNLARNKEGIACNSRLPFFVSKIDKGKCLKSLNAKGNNASLGKEMEKANLKAVQGMFEGKMQAQALKVCKCKQNKGVKMQAKELEC